MRTAPFLALALFCVAASAQAGQNTLAVAGEIKPAGCTLALENNGSLDFGAYGYNNLQPDAPTQLGERRGMSMSIACGATRNVAILVEDQRAHSGQPDPEKFTLATQGGAVVAWYTIGAHARPNNGSGTLVGKIPGDGAWGIRNTLTHGWWHAAGQRTNPVEIHNAEFLLSIYGYVDALENVDPQQPLDFDGSLSLSLVYF